MADYTNFVLSTASSSTNQIDGGEMVRYPSSDLHAKHVGSNRTLCGLATGNWVKFWTLDFEMHRGSRCRECLQSVIDERIGRVPHHSGCDRCAHEKMWRDFVKAAGRVDTLARLRQGTNPPRPRTSTDGQRRAG